MSLEIMPQQSNDIRCDKDDSNGKNGASYSPKQIHVTNDSTQSHNVSQIAFILLFANIPLMQI